MRGNEYAELKAFVAVVAHGNFARAAAELGMSASALSQTIRELETRLGVRLLNRTTRSLSLTDAGARLHARFKPAMIEMEAAVADVAGLRDTPAGPLRVHMPSVAAAAYLKPVLGRFHEAYPDIVLDVTIDDRVVDIVEAGYDGCRQMLTDEGQHLGPSLQIASTSGQFARSVQGKYATTHAKRGARGSEQNDRVRSRTLWELFPLSFVAAR